MSVGESNTPFVTVAKVQLEVASCHVTSEYVSANNARKCIMHNQQLSEQLGWSQPATPFSLIIKRVSTWLRRQRLLEKPNIFSNIITTFVQRFLRFIYVASPLNRADVLTKLFSRMSFQRGAQGLLNRASLP